MNKKYNNAEINVDDRDYHLHKSLVKNIAIETHHERTQIRLKELKEAGCKVIGIGHFGLKFIISGIYIERVWSMEVEQWADYIKWIKEVISNKTMDHE